MPAPTDQNRMSGRMGSHTPRVYRLFQTISAILTTACSCFFLAVYSYAPMYVGKMVKGDSCFSLLDGRYFTAGFLVFSGIIFLQFFSLGALLFGSKDLNWPSKTILVSAILTILGIVGNLTANCIFIF